MTSAGTPSQAAGGGTSLPDLPPPLLSGGQADPNVSPFGSESSGEGFGSILRTLKRRQGIFLFTTSLVSGLLALNTLRELKFSPVYAGNFILQIESTSSNEQVLNSEGKIETLARAKVKNNIPALRAILTSPLVVAPVAERMGVQASDIISRLSIEQGDNTDAVMRVSLSWKNPEQGRAILDNLAKDFVKFSLIQRQQSIDSGMKWLETQAPSILSNVNRYEGKLKTFREKNLVIDPSENAQDIIQQRNILIGEVSRLQVEQAQIQNQIQIVKSGKLTYNPTGAPTPIQQLGRQGTLIPSASESSSQVLQQTEGAVNPTDEYQKYEVELAKARAVYRDDSPVVQSIMANRDALAPVVRKQQIDQLTDTLFRNAKRQDELNRQILLLNQNFKQSPVTLQEYNDISQRLQSARENYASYISALENFKLEKARFVTPWQVISPPLF